jgi:small subunit ribosomal protein S8
MVLNDTLANVLSQINNATRVEKFFVKTNVAAKLIKKVLAIMQENGYLNKVEEVVDSKGNYYNIELSGKLNKCGSIKPRFAVKLADFEKFEKRYLPAKGFGFIIVSTSQGIMTHEEAKAKNIGGKLISYCY